MVLLVFLNKYDKQSKVLGNALPQYLKGDYVKMYTRYDSKQYEKCVIESTLPKIKEYASVFDKVIVSFGLRLFPPSAYKDIITEYNKTESSMVFLKKLKGSKTWSVSDGELKFDNYRIADTGLFILKSEDLLNDKNTNFNYFLRDLINEKKLKYKYVPYWVLTNRQSQKLKSYIHKSKKSKEDK